MTIDAAEIARLRENLKRCPDQLGFMSSDEALALLDELEKARFVADEYHKRWLPLCCERDAAHALLREALPMMDCSEHFRDLRARIDTLLDDA